MQAYAALQVHARAPFSYTVTIFRLERTCFRTSCAAILSPQGTDWTESTPRVASVKTPHTTP